MKVLLDNYSLAFLLDEEKEEVILPIKQAFTFEDQSMVFAGGSYDPKKIKKVCFIKKEGKAYILRSGFAYEFFSLCKKYNIKITEFKDKRDRFPHQLKEYTDDDISPLFPFDYNAHQIRALKSILKSNTGIIKATTSAGKTEMIIAYLKIARLPTLILVNKVTLASQTAKRIKDAGVKNVGLFHGKSKVQGDVVVATIGSVKKIPNLDHFKVLIIDEVHRSAASEFQEFLKRTSYPIRLGFSATPEGNDKYRWSLIRQYLGSILVEIEAKELLENKVIAVPKINIVPVEGVPAMDWPSSYMASIVYNKERNDKIKSIIQERKLPTLILVKILEHGKILEDLLPNSFFVSGEHSQAEREEVIEKFTRGEITNLISSNIFNEGISINAIRLLIIASGGKSRIETVQKLGRALRLDTGKEAIEVIDFDDYGNKFTQRHSDYRISVYKKIGFEVKEQ